MEVTLVLKKAGRADPHPQQKRRWLILEQLNKPYELQSDLKTKNQILTIAEFTENNRSHQFWVKKLRPCCVLRPLYPPLLSIYLVYLLFHLLINSSIHFFIQLVTNYFKLSS